MALNYSNNEKVDTFLHNERLAPTNNGDIVKFLQKFLVKPGENVDALELPDLTKLSNKDKILLKKMLFENNLVQIEGLRWVAAALGEEQNGGGVGQPYSGGSKKRRKRTKQRKPSLKKSKRKKSKRKKTKRRRN